MKKILPQAAHRQSSEGNPSVEAPNSQLTLECAKFTKNHLASTPLLLVLSWHKLTANAGSWLHANNWQMGNVQGRFHCKVLPLNIQETLRGHATIHWFHARCIKGKYGIFWKSRLSD